MTTWELFLLVEDDGKMHQNTMADMNIPATDAPAEEAHAITPPTRTDDQILPKNLATTSRGKKKTTHLLIPTIRYVGKDGREIFGMPILDALLTDEIKGAPYYGEYHEHVAKYQQHLDAEHGKAAERGAIESSKATKVEEPAYNEEDANPQRALELSLKEKAERTQGPACPVVIRKPDSGRSQPLSEVQRKGKEKVVEEQAIHDLLTLQTLKNKIHVDQFIFQRHTHMPAEAFGPDESPSLDAELALPYSETESDDEVLTINTGDQDEGQARSNPGIQDKGQAGPNPGVQDEGQAGSNPGDAAGSQPQSSHVVHDGPNLEPIDLEATDVSHLQNLKQLDEEFTTTAYPNVQENLKLPYKDSMILKRTCKLHWNPVFSAKP
nr:hypothetical protein [Tanacetum cinerariifolium]